MLYDGKAKACSFHLPTIICAIETIENEGNGILRNTHTIILHTDEHIPFHTALRTQLKVKPGSGIILQRILHEIKENLRPIELIPIQHEGLR